MDNYGFMYMAQFCIGTSVIIVRTWEDVLLVLDKIVEHYNLSVKRRMVIYVHNLAFEFQFIRAFLKWDNIFAVDERVPVKAITANGYEFRCSYKLSNMGLSKFLEKTEGVVHYKLSGKSFDYSKIRTKDTPLSDYEYLYGAYDVLGLHEAIESLLRHDTLASIPLTSTGYVRREFRKAVLSNKANHQLIKDCRIDEFIYLLLRTARRGGDCAANPVLSSQIIRDVASYDIKSSYPYVMATRKYPMGQWVEDSLSNIQYDTRAYIICIRLNNIRIKDSNQIGYIATHKCTAKDGAVNCNGRIIKAISVSLVITEIDYRIIHERYDIKSEDISMAFSAPKDMLPKEFREKLMEYFQQKCDLEGVDKYLYAKSKNRINAAFGMMLTDICNDNIVYKYWGEWDTETVDAQSQIDKYFDSNKSFLAYQWGVWVTAYARERLAEPYNIIYKDAVYCDTDSWKIAGDYSDLFDTINSRIISEAEMYDIKPYAYRKDGNKEYLGVWEYEGTYDRFVTLGAKKYCTETDGKCEVTVSGLSKERGAEYINKIGGIEKFKDGLVFPEEYSGRTVSVYDDDNTIRQITVQGSTFTTASSLALHNTTYTLDRTGEYRSLLGVIKKYGISNID